MFLKRLELQGFKSFADKVSLDLTSGVTAIVGPNGSGKSNIIDGVRWLLGERDARQLRGGRSEDLIFAGTEKRPRVGLAQASFVFDNGSGVFPLDFKEVGISRRLGRDGDTHFFLNKSEVRLKDIAELLAKIKVGPRGLAVVNQGESDIFVKASPLERRTMIEEILGLKEYEIKKEEAGRRLENAFANLEKLKLSLEEIKPHLRFLKKQVSRYESREKFAEELRRLENNFYGRRLGAIKKGEKELASREAKLKEQITRQEKVFTEAEVEMKKIGEPETETNTVLKELQAERNSILSEREKLQKELGRFEVRLELEAKSGGGETDFPRIINEVRRVAKNLLEENDPAKLKSGLQEILNLLENKGDLPEKADKEIVAEIESITKNLKNLDQALEEVIHEEEKARGTIISFNERFKSAYALVESERKKLEALKEEENHLVIERERLVSRQTALHEELAQIGRDLQSLRVDRSEASEPMNEEQVLKLMLKLRGELASIGEVDEALIEEAKETEERYNFLSAESVDLERAMADLKKLIRDLEEKINKEFNLAIKLINQEFNKLVSLMFGGGKARLTVESPKEIKVEGEEGTEEPKSEEAVSVIPGVEIDLSLPRKRIKGLDMLSGGERSLVSIAALFALISVSSPPFLVLDEIDVALDEKNAKRFGEMLKDLSGRTQFIVVTHNRATMEVADVLYGVTMAPDGTSKLVSLKLA